MRPSHVQKRRASLSYNNYRRVIHLVKIPGAGYRT